jgi:ribonucleoside-diphosphate reductase alpha chain
MRVLKRSGGYENVSFDKVLHRIEKLAGDLNGIQSPNDLHTIAQKICSSIYDGVKTSELDELTAQTCYALSTEHPDYGTLAARISISNHHKNTSPSFSETMGMLYNNTDRKGIPNPLISAELWETVQANKEKLNAVMNYERDFLFDYFGFKTLERLYLIRVNGKPVERPQHLWMRVALGIHGDDIKEAIEGYEWMSQRYYTHATPTLFNSGTTRPQMSSCFLMSIKDNQDSIEGMYSTLKDMMHISKSAGGIGLHIHNIRARGSYIRGTNGTSTGLTPFCRVLNESTRHVNQGGKRNGSAAIYLEPWHSDVFEFISLRRNTGAEEERCRDLFIALWIPDLFMKRVQENGTWSLFCPDEAPGLAEVYGEAFESLYERYESAGIARRTVKAQDLFVEIMKSQIETGGPYMLYKDACQRSNQSNLGVIKSSNLCSEILLYSDEKEYGVCNLSSIVLPSFVEQTAGGGLEALAGKKVFNFDRLAQVVRYVVRSMEKVIDRNYYPIPETRRSNFRHRPIGIGIQGLADAFLRMRMPYESPEAATLNQQIAETMYYAAIQESCAIAEERTKRIQAWQAAKLTGAPEEALLELRSKIATNDWDYPELAATWKYPGAYSTYEGSPMSEGKFQFDLWGIQPTPGRHDWDGLRAKVAEWGIRHSCLIALMPTASTSQIMGSTESFEAITSNIYQRRTLAGEFIILNKFLVQDLLEHNLWNTDMKNRILANNGSIQTITEIPESIRELYKTIWEIKQRSVIDQSADRGPFVCHTQSLNLYVEDPDYKKIMNMHFYSWKKNLKTGLYYLRTRPKAKTMSFTLDPLMLQKEQAKASAAKTAQKTAVSDAAAAAAASAQAEAAAVCRRDNPEGCLMCSS